jgi:hypothetical protein
MHWMLGLTVVITSGVLISNCQTVSPALGPPSAAVVESRGTVAFRNVNVITMAGREPPLIRTTVVVSQGVITSIGVGIPPGAHIIEGNGKWLIPGFIDMHVHLPADSHFRIRLPTEGANFFFITQDVMTPFVANGVTTILECTSRADHFSQRNEIARGLAIGPRMGLAALINGGDGDGRRANTASDGRQAVRDAKAEGYDFIKVYSDLDVEVLRAIVDESAKRGMKVVGHIPNKCKGQTSECLNPQFGLVAHAEELAKQADALRSLMPKPSQPPCRESRRLKTDARSPEQQLWICRLQRLSTTTSAHKISFTESWVRRSRIPAPVTLLCVRRASLPSARASRN